MRKPPTGQEVRSWYNKKYASEGVRNKRPYEAYTVFLDYLGSQRGRRLLDVACGIGLLLCAASKRGLETFGIDISEEAVRLAKGISPDSVISVGEAEDIRFGDNTFDYVTCLGSLEHFLDMDKGLFEMKRVAKNNALFCIMVPNSNFIFWKLFAKYGTEQQDINENLLSLEQWKGAFIRNGFEIIDIHRDKWYMKFQQTNFPGIAKRMVCRILWMFIPLRYDYQFAFILKKTDKNNSQK
ncbi:MAG: class I SAM-dependent methyltransferase [Candidatus Omnitrophota bacterium]